jgi:hypothetical protein
MARSNRGAGRKRSASRGRHSTGGSRSSRQSQTGSGARSGRSAGTSRGQSAAQSRSRSASQSRGLSSRSGSTSRRATNVTTDHEVIRRWAEERGAKPACVRRTGGKGDIGMIRLEFPGAPGARDENLQEISWDDWFRKFDESGLAFLHEETTASGQRSNFNKLVKRETAQATGKAKAKSARA